MAINNDLSKMLENTKEDAPLPVSLFRKFLTNDFAHLKWQVSLNTKLLFIVLGIVIAAAVTVIGKGL